MKLLSFVLFLCFCLSVSGQTSPISWDFSQEKIKENVYAVTLSADIESPWYMYSQHTDPAGPVPTKITFDEQEGVELVRNLEEKGNLIKEVSELFEVEVLKFKNELNFVQKLRLDDSVKSISGTVLFMTCDGNRCLPPTEVKFDIPIEQ